MRLSNVQSPTWCRWQVPSSRFQRRPTRLDRRKSLFFCWAHVDSIGQSNSGLSNGMRRLLCRVPPFDNDDAARRTIWVCKLHAAPKCPYLSTYLPHSPDRRMTSGAIEWADMLQDGMKSSASSAPLLDRPPSVQTASYVLTLDHTISDGRATTVHYPICWLAGAAVSRGSGRWLGVSVSLAVVT